MSYVRGMAASTVWDTFMSVVPGTAQFCADPASLLSPFQGLCLPYDVNKKTDQFINPTTPPPAPAPPSISVVSAGTPGAILAGNDSSGNPVYVLPQGSLANAAQNNAAIQAWFANYSAANPPVDCSTFLNSLFNPVCYGSGATPIDCTTFYNANFNSQCGGSMAYLFLLVGVGIFGLVLMVKR